MIKLRPSIDIPKCYINAHRINKFGIKERTKIPYYPHGISARDAQLGWKRINVN